MSNVQSIEVFLPEHPADDLQVWLYHEYDTNAVVVHDSHDNAFAVVWLYPHPTRTQAKELEGQEAIAAAISERVGYHVPLWAANPYNSAGSIVEARWAKTGELICDVCGKTFEARTGRDGPRYCSPACRQKAFRERRRG